MITVQTVKRWDALYGKVRQAVLLARQVRLGHRGLQDPDLRFAHAKLLAEAAQHRRELVTLGTQIGTYRYGRS